ncbi:DUF6304 family protein [Formosa sp. L2A11]|uniref:DUF6304 family protein n=1 Tax=Formosa sp. L2A11 TaxID=2686363 RepID=UPI00131E28ED|nr:DUF6304 family protein [Formosa sp. L2A11]
MKIYSVKYKDTFGSLNTKIYSDGSILNLTLRGVHFKGYDFEALEGIVDKSKFEYAVYDNGVGVLTNFELTTEMPIDILDNGIVKTENLIAYIATGSNKSSVRLTLKTEHGIFLNKVEYDSFEDAILNIQNQLPENVKIKTCLSCKYSNYHPVGNGMFGGLNCFKNVKEDLEQVCNKSDLMHLWDKGLEENKTFNVQETNVCSSHKFVTKNNWVYKNWTS